MSDDKKPAPPFDHEAALKQRLAPRASRVEREELVREMQIATEFAALSDAEKLRRVVELDKLARNLAEGHKQREQIHKHELLMQSRGRTVDAMTKLLMDRREREHDHVCRRNHSLVDALKEAIEIVGDTERTRAWRELLDLSLPPPKPTPGHVLMAFRPAPVQITAQDVVREIESHYEGRCPEVLRLVVERALARDS